jgi:hypothetical protein
MGRAKTQVPLPFRRGFKNGYAAKFSMNAASDTKALFKGELRIYFSTSAFASKGVTLMYFQPDMSRTEGSVL